jgi:peptidoglycan/xylan/chitin deacetylase (PgdA/CDA1 family)
MHRVIPDTGRERICANSRIEITPEFLESLLVFFRKRNYEIVSLDDMHARLFSNPVKRPFVCFTFDDGYSDILRNALPVFEKHQAPFAVYVVTSFADRRAPLWWYMLEDLLLESPAEVEISIKGSPCRVQTATIEEKEAAFNHIREILMNIPQHELSDEVEKIFSPLGITARQYENHLMSWDQVSELASHPLATVGAHTVHHYNLKELPAHEALAEIRDSRDRLQDRLGTPVRHLAYPFGSQVECGRREFHMARECGFATAVTVREGAVFPEHREYTQCLPRIEITGRHQDLTLVDMRRCGLISLLRNGPRRVITE